MTRTEQRLAFLRRGVTFYPRFVPVLYGGGKWMPDLAKLEVAERSQLAVREMVAKVEPWKTRIAKHAAAGR